MKIQVLKHDGLYHVGDRYMIEHNHPLLTVTYPNFPSDLDGTIRGLRKSGFDMSRIIDFVHLRTGCLLNRLQPALMESPDLRRALVANTDKLLLYMETECKSRVLEMEIGGEVKRTAILTATSNEQDDLRRFGDVVLLDGTAIQDELGRTAYPITLIEDERMLGSGGLLLTACELEETFEWILKNLDQMLGSMLRTILGDQDSSIIPAMQEKESILQMGRQRRV
jgi:hypothetical protein